MTQSQYIAGWMAMFIAFIQLVLSLVEGLLRESISRFGIKDIYEVLTMCNILMILLILYVLL